MTQNHCDRCGAVTPIPPALMHFRGTVTRDLCLACYKAFAAWCALSPVEPVLFVPPPTPVRVVHQRPKPKAKAKKRR